MLVLVLVLVLVAAVLGVLETELHLPPPSKAAQAQGQLEQELGLNHPSPSTVLSGLLVVSPAALAWAGQALPLVLVRVWVRWAGTPSLPLWQTPRLQRLGT